MPTGLTRRERSYLESTYQKCGCGNTAKNGKMFCGRCDPENQPKTVEIEVAHLEVLIELAEACTGGDDEHEPHVEAIAHAKGLLP